MPFITSLARNVRRTFSHQWIGLLALVLACSGTSYAATRLAANSVGTPQLRAKAVTLPKIAPSARAALKGAKGAKGNAGATGATGATGAQGEQGPQGVKGDTGPSTGPAGGDLAGAYPNPAVANGAITAAKQAAWPAGYYQTDPGTTTPTICYNHGTCNPSVVPADGGGYFCFASTGANVLAGVTLADAFNQCGPGEYSSFTVPTNGFYLLTANVEWDSSVDGTRELSIQDDHTNIPLASTTPAGTAGTTFQTVSGVVDLQAGHSIMANVWQSSSNPVDVVAGGLTVNWIGPDA